MLTTLGRYLRWWFADHRQDRLVIGAPLMVIVCLLGVVQCARQGEHLVLLGFVAILLFGLLCFSDGAILYRGKPKPWDPQPDSEDNRT